MRLSRDLALVRAASLLCLLVATYSYARNSSGPGLDKQRVGANVPWPGGLGPLRGATWRRLGNYGRRNISGAAKGGILPLKLPARDDKKALARPNGNCWAAGSRRGPLRLDVWRPGAVHMPAPRR